VSQIGAIFDWDGVVIDSSAAHEVSWDRLAQEQRRPLPPGHFKEGFGRKSEYIIRNILGWTQDPGEARRLSARKEELYREVVVERGIAPLPGVREFLARLRDSAIPCAVGSSTERKNIDTILALIGLGGFFSAIVSADDVTIGKPNPQVFLLAAQQIGVPAARCVVFEDALVGLEAARAGGMKAVGVATTHPPEGLVGADRVVRRLDELSLADLRKLFDGVLDN
jgi:beta-phosphoglucomutase family hydrolase